MNNWRIKNLTSILSDEACVPGTANFTDSFVGVACQDMSGTACAVDFDSFDYRERAYRVNPMSEAAE